MYLLLVLQCHFTNSTLPLFGVTGDSGWPRLEPAHAWSCSSWEEAGKSILGQRPEGPSVPLEVTGSWPPSPLCHGRGWDEALQNHPGLESCTRALGCVKEEVTPVAKIIWGLSLTSCPDLTPETLHQHLEFSSELYLFI